MRGSRAAGGDGGAADWRAGGSRSQMAAITDDSTSPADSASSAASSEKAAASVGSVNDAAAVPSCTEVWRSPSARPRSLRGNQPNTARPLPPVAAAANSPAANTPASSAP